MKNGADRPSPTSMPPAVVLGKKLKLEVGDDACDPKQARSVAEKLAGMKVPFVAGHFCSSSSIPASEAYVEEQRAADHAGVDQPDIHRTQAVEHVPRLRPRRPAGRASPPTIIAKNFKGKNIAILHDKTTYGKGLADETKKALNKAGVKEKLYEVLQQGRQGLHRARLAS